MLEGDRHDLGRVEREREKVRRVALAEREQARAEPSPKPGMLGMCTADPAQSIISTQTM
jgi:hypothetical protein